MENNNISFLSEDGENIELNIIEETKLNGVSYILVTDSIEDENGECYIMKDISAEEDEEANFIFVEDDKELNAVFEIFEKMMNGEDVEITR
jgi:hypothetical protein